MATSPLDIAISALENEVSKLEVSIDGLEKWLWISSTAVAIGVALEILFLVHEHLGERDAWRRGILVTPARPSRRILAFEIASVLLVFAGIVGELWVGVVSGARNTDLRNKTSRLVSLIREKAGNAEAEAGHANERAAEIEESVAPRRLTASQRASIESKLSRFVGQAFGAWHDTFDLESSIFARELVSALNDKARWKAKTNFNVGGSVSMFTAAPALPDIGILISATKDTTSQRASEALIHELVNNGFDCKRGEEFVKGATGPVREPFIYIHVLARPEGPQGEAKVRAQKAKNRP